MRALNSKNNKGAAAFNVTAAVQGLFFTVLLVILISLVLAVMVSFFDWESSTKILNVLAHSAVIGGAIWAGNRCGKKAWLHGVAVGVMAFLLFKKIPCRSP
ncbi:MAG TPA: TIGR04086 family membrane protein, partial [Firmicutes bacterium]|nr:TIGR04086 family membrane protein [Bacillota bacterium]